MYIQGVKNIIFDLGDVIININPNNAIRAFQDLFGVYYTDLEQALLTENIFDKYEVGEITSSQFISFFKQFDGNITDKQIINAWNSTLLDIPKYRLVLIKELAKKYQVFLLSNTNEIHLQYINDYVESQFKMKTMDVLFEKAYYSHEIGLRKPNSQIFKFVLEDKNLLAQETLFIDDSFEHIETAKRLNLKTHHLVKPETIINLFNAN